MIFSYSKNLVIIEVFRRVISLSIDLFFPKDVMLDGALENSNNFTVLYINENTRYKGAGHK